MTDPATERDEVVARALRELPVPQHAPSFWTDLDRAIAGEPEATPGDPGDRRLATGELPAISTLADARERRSRRAPLLAAAAAVVVLAAAVGLVLVAGGGDGTDDADLADGGTVTTAAVADEPAAPESAPTTPPEPVESTVLAEEGAASPEDAVVQWIEALGEGETERAAELLGPRTLGYLEAIGADAVGFMEESQEGYGAWAGSPDVEVRATTVGPVELLGPGAQLAIVTLTGTHPGEGDARFRVEAIPVVDDGSGWLIEHLAFSPERDNRLVFTVPRSSESGLGGMNPDDDVNVFVPAHGTVFFSVDGGDLYADATSLVGSQAEPFALYNPPGDLETGTHSLVVVAVGDDGTITTFGGTFTVEG